MSNKGKLGIAALLIAVCGGVFLLRNDQAIQPKAFEFAWKHDLAISHRYGLIFEGGGQVTSNEETSKSKIVLHADWVVSAQKSKDNQTILEWQIENLTRAEIWAGGQDLVKQGVVKSFEKGRLFTVLDENGSIKDVYASTDMEGIVDQVLQLIIGELDVRIQNEASWTEHQSGILGDGMVEYAFVENKDRQLNLKRTRTNYDLLYSFDADHSLEGLAINSNTKITLHQDGYLLSVLGEELTKLQFSDSVPYQMYWLLKLEHLAVETKGATERPLLSDAEKTRKLPKMKDIKAVAEKRALQARSGSMTPEKFISNMVKFGGGGMMPNHKRWLWETIALLKLHPELCLALPGLLDTQSFSNDGQVLLVNLMTLVGHDEAQTAMRQMLSHSTFTESPSFARFVEETTMFEKPNDKTIEFLQDLQVTGDSASIQAAASNGLGKAARVLSANGRHADAVELGQEIMTRVQNANDANERRDYLVAMANARLDEFVPDLIEEASHKDGAVRGAAIDALGYSKKPEVRAKLWDYAEDGDSWIRKRSLAALKRQEFQSSEVDKLSELTRSGNYADVELIRLLRVAERLVDAKPEEAAKIYLAVNSRNSKLPSVISKLEVLQLKLMQLRAL